jgi:predicted dehydrogenase
MSAPARRSVPADRPVDFAVVGTGHIFERRGRDIAQSPDARLVAIAEPHDGRRQETASRWGVEAFADSLEMLERVDCDAVLVCTPTRFHHPVVMAALAAGRHVMCEKPAAETVAQAAEMAALAEEMHAVLGYTFHFAEMTHEATRLITAGALGNVVMIDARWVGRSRPPVRDGIVPATAWADLGPHLVATALQWLGNRPVVSVTSNEWDVRDGRPSMSSWGRVPDRRFGSDTTAATVVFAGGVVLRAFVSFNVHQRAAESVGLTAYGTDGTMTVPLRTKLTEDDAYQPRLFTARDDLWLDSTIRDPLGLVLDEDACTARELARFVRAVRGEGQPLVGGLQGVAIQQVLELVTRSAADGGRQIVVTE